MVQIRPQPPFLWLHGQAVKTSPFHGGNAGSIPAGVTKNNNHLMVVVIFLLFPRNHNSTQLKFASRASNACERHERSEYPRWSHHKTPYPFGWGVFVWLPSRNQPSRIEGSLAEQATLANATSKASIPAGLTSNNLNRPLN